VGELMRDGCSKSGFKGLGGKREGDSRSLSCL